MRFLIDNALSPVLSRALTGAGHNAIHVRDRNMQAAPDEAIFELAEREDEVLVSADTDFAFLLAVRGAAKPSVILFRRATERIPLQQVALLINNLQAITPALLEGSLVVFEQNRIRIRRLHILRER